MKFDAYHITLILLSWSFSLVTDDSADISTCYSHTKGHISYYVTGKEDENPTVFTGDTMVSGNIKAKAGWILMLTKSIKCFTLASQIINTFVLCPNES